MAVRHTGSPSIQSQIGHLNLRARVTTSLGTAADRAAQATREGTQQARQRGTATARASGREAGVWITSTTVEGLAASRDGDRGAEDRIGGTARTRSTSAARRAVRSRPAQKSAGPAGPAEKFRGAAERSHGWRSAAGSSRTATQHRSGRPPRQEGRGVSPRAARRGRGGPWGTARRGGQGLDKGPWSSRRPRPSTRARARRAAQRLTSRTLGRTLGRGVGMLSRTTLGQGAARLMQPALAAARAVLAALASASTPMWAVAGVLALVLSILALLVSIIPTASSTVLCSPSAPAVSVQQLPGHQLAGYGPAELTRASTIMRAAQAAGLDRRAQLIGIMAAIQESDLGRDPRSATPNAGGHAGLFQQRTAPGWFGTLDQVNDPAYAARAFFEGVTAQAPGGYGSAGGGSGHGHLPGLRDVRGWRMMPLGAAAEAVQRSGDASSYGVHEAAANEIVTGLSRTASMVSAGQASSGDDDAGPYRLGPVQPGTITAAQVATQFGIATVEGWRPAAAPGSDPSHAAGRGLDFVVGATAAGKATGDRLVSHLQSHAAELGVETIAWQNRAWTAGQSAMSWHSPSSPAESTLDHVHVTVKPTPSALPPAAAGLAGAAGCPGMGAAGQAAPGAVSASGWAAPAQGPITSGYGGRVSPGGIGTPWHDGIDLGGGGCGGPIWAARAGKVTVAGPVSGYGNGIEIDHGDGTSTFYGHMYTAGVMVRAGQSVTAGQVIGQVGSAGISTGCHLHFTLKSNGTAIDPVPVLQKSGVTIQ